MNARRPLPKQLGTLLGGVGHPEKRLGVGMTPYGQAIPTDARGSFSGIDGQAWFTRLAAAAGARCDGAACGAGAALMTLAERLLPGPGGIGTEARLGAESESRWSPSLLTTLGDRAAARNNEVASGRTDPATHESYGL